jgi:5'-deoxynucleotidase YfbR-like HD superfamily hydrolase
MSNINDLLKIIRLTNRFGQIRRVMLISGERRHENDLEHTAQLALVAWAIALQNKIKLRQDKLTHFYILKIKKKFRVKKLVSTRRCYV